jgi:hypothetical protein
MVKEIMIQLSFEENCAGALEGIIYRKRYLFYPSKREKSALLSPKVTLDI